MTSFRTVPISLTLILCVQGFHTARKDQGQLCVYFPGVNTEKSNAYINQIQNDDNSEDYVTKETELGTTDILHVRCSTNYCYAALMDDPLSNETKIIKQGCWESAGTHDCERSICAPERRYQQKKMRFCCCTGDLCNFNITDIPVEEEEGKDGGQAEDSPRKAAHESESALLYVTLSVLVTFIVAFMVSAALYCFWNGVGVRGLQKSDPDAVRLMEGGRGPGCGFGHIMGSYSGDQIKFLNIVGQGRYGSVWRATVGEHEVAVKVFPSHYRSYFLNEKDIYCLPFMGDCKALLSYYGCDERTSIEGNIEYILVLSYSPNGCLQEYLRSKPIDWPTFCRMSLSIAKGLAHLHTDIHKGDKVKPCVSHRDLNSRNILVNSDLSCSLCDLGFAMKIVGSKYYQNGEEQHAETKSINDVGTLRYMAPEVLEGAVNLRDCESSLKQIDVYALGLVLWELSCCCADLYQPGLEVPPFRMAFEAEIGHHPTFEQMQVLLLRHKARPLFPESWRDLLAVRLIRETMEDCWDQDAEARLTALCVEERLSELPSLWERQRSTILTSGLSPTVNPSLGVCSNRSTINNSISNNTNSGIDTQRLILDSADETGGSARSASSQKDAQESTVSEGTVETLLTLSPSDPPDTALYKSWHKGPLQPYQGRNPCMERNLMPPAVSEEELSRQSQKLVDRSSKHTRPGGSCGDTQALVSSDFLQQQGHLNIGSNVRSITPIPYVQNVVYSPQQPSVEVTSSPRRGLLSGWVGGLRRLLESRKKSPSQPKDNSLSCDSTEARLNLLPGRDTQVSLATSSSCGVVTTVLDSEGTRNTDVIRTVSTGSPNPAVRPTTLSLSNVAPTLTPDNGKPAVKRRLGADCQDMFSSSSVDWKLKDPTLRIKTPGDVPASVRKNRGRGFATRFSLYDDRIMTGTESGQNVDLAELEQDGVLEVCIPAMFSSVPYQINTVPDEVGHNDSMF